MNNNGNITIINDDCLNYMKSLDDSSIDMVCADPPYGTTQCQWDSIIDLDVMWTQLKRIVKPNGAIVIFSSQPYTSKLISSNYSMFSQELIWKKNIASNFLHVNKRHLSVHENIILFCKKQPTYNKQYRKGEAYTRKRKAKDDLGSIYGVGNMKQRTLGKGEKDKRNPITLLEFDRPSNTTRCHPSEKPVDLLKYLIATYTNENETVLDFTMGSGSTGVAAKELKRKFIGIEKDKSVFELAQKRISMSIDEWINYIEAKNKKEREEKKSSNK
jgi:site-specific DNA-methyltransferase (adenine-specific)